jgi:hypothetical protein
MNVLDNILLMLGEIKGELVELRKLHERVARLEMWQWWLKGAYAVMVYAFLFKTTLGH